MGRSRETVPQVLHEMMLTDMMVVRQRNDEPVMDYVQKFWDIRSRYFSLSLSDSKLAELVFQGLLPHIKEMFSIQEFESLSYLVSDPG